MIALQSPTDRRYVSPLEVSRALGVSETTVKRWVDTKRLPGQKTAGGHRRILVADVLAMIREKNWPHVNLAALHDSAPAMLEAEALQQTLYETLIAGDHERARRLVTGAYQSGWSIAQLGDEVVSPVMVRLGHGWAEGTLDVFQEHRGTQVCLAALQSLKALLDACPPEPTAPLAIGGGPEGDHYHLASLLIKLTFRELGWRAINIGPNTPFPSFVRAMDELQPKAIWLSCSYVADEPTFLAGYAMMCEQAAARGIGVCFGGRALGGISERMAGVHCTRLADLVGIVKRDEVS